MNRLTKRDQFSGMVDFAKPYFEPVAPVGEVMEALEKLAAYEDTGLEPEEVEACKVALMGKSLAEIKEIESLPVERMKELAKADAEGRLVVPPCKVGDLVYFVQSDEDVFCGKVYAISTGNGSNWFSARYNNGLRYDHSWGEIGKTVFLTREEAEAALRKEQSDGKS